MKPTTLTGLLLNLLFAAQNVVAAENIRAIFLFKDVMKSNTTALRTSGFNTLIMFGVGIKANADIMYYSNTPGSVDVVVASGGVYTGGVALSEKVRSLKANTTTTTTSGVTRIEVSMNSQNIKNLMATPGSGSGTTLYKNFAALKEAWGLDAVNNDDESLYDVPSTVAFGKMLGKMGYKYTIAPYTNLGFWQRLKTQLNQGLTAETEWLLDRVYLQCYDGGANNNPASWTRDLGMKVVPLIWVVNNSKPSFGATAAQARTRFQNWNRQQGALAGGGYWNDYDIEKMGLSYREYGEVLKAVFP